MSECTHNCESCGENCPSRTGGAPASLLEKPHELSSIKKVIAVVSGKGGVGKSLVTSLMATLMQRRGYQSAILDADVRQHCLLRRRRPPQLRAFPFEVAPLAAA